MSHRFIAFLKNPDQWLLILRLLLLGGAFVSGVQLTFKWVFLLFAYSIFCSVLYYLLYKNFPKTRSVYYASLYGDLVFVAFGVAASGGWKSDGYLGFVLITGTAAAYFGYRVFPALPATASMLYVISIVFSGQETFPTAAVLLRCFAFWIIPLSIAVFHEWRQTELADVKNKQQQDEARGGVLLERIFTIKDEMQRKIDKCTLESMCLTAGELGKVINSKIIDLDLLSRKLTEIGAMELYNSDNVEFTYLLKEQLLHREGELLKSGIKVKKIFNNHPLLITGNKELIKQLITLIIDLTLRDLKYGGKLILNEQVDKRQTVESSSLVFSVIMSEQKNEDLTIDNIFYDNNKRTFDSWSYFIPSNGDFRPLELYSIVFRHRGEIFVSPIHGGKLICIKLKINDSKTQNEEVTHDKNLVEMQT